MLTPSSPNLSSDVDIPVGIYARISSADEGDTVGVERQIHDGELICKMRGWRVHDYYIDNNVSASKWDKIREDFNRITNDLESGVIKGIVGYDIDRLFRLPVDLERTIKIYDWYRNRNEPLVFATAQGDINLTSDDGITLARVMVAFANKESRNTSRRVKSKHAELARMGIPAGSRRPFGWKASPELLQRLAIAKLGGDPVEIEVAQAKVFYEEKRRVDPLEAQLIREGAYDILAGHGVYELASRWNDGGYRTPQGNLWIQSVVRNLYLSPRLAGYRVHHRDIARDDQGNPVIGQFDPILDAPTWEAVTKVLQDRAKMRSQRPGARKYLLSGLLRCALCGSKMRSWAATNKDLYYRCPPKNDGGGCNKVAIIGAKAEKHVVLLWKAYVSMKEDTGNEIEPWPGEEDVTKAEAKISELMEAYHADLMPANRVFPMVDRLERDINRLKAERAEWIQSQHKFGGQSISVEDWDAMSIAEQRIELTQHFSAILVHPSPVKHSGVFDPARIEPVWHERGGGGSGATPRLALVAR